jgi:predicted RecB family endonuclease
MNDSLETYKELKEKVVYLEGERNKLIGVLQTVEVELKELMAKYGVNDVEDLYKILETNVSNVVKIKTEWENKVNEVLEDIKKIGPF